MESEKSDPITENIVNGVKRSLDNSSKDQSPIEQSASDVKSLERGIREDMVESAVRFLQNPRVQQRSYSDKTSFLKSKGLTNEEIQMACTRSGTGDAGEENKVKHQGTLSNRSRNQSFPINQTYKSYEAVGAYRWWYRLRDFINFVALIGGSGYVLHMLWKNYIYGMFFDDKKKRLTTTEETLKVTQKIATGIEKLQSSMENLATSIDTQTNKVEEVLQLQNENSEDINYNGNRKVGDAYESLNSTTAELKKEIQSIKGLLLSPSRFPLNPTITPISLPKSNSIPSANVSSANIPNWQLEDENKSDNTPKQRKEDEIVDGTFQDSGSDDRMNGSDTNTELVEEKDVSKPESREFDQLVTSTETNENTLESFQTNETEDGTATNVSKEDNNAGKIVERIDKRGKKKYRVDPDLLIGYSRRTII